MTATIPCYCYADPKTERELHKTLMGFLRVALPRPWLVNHQPNEGSRGWQAQRDLADFGVIAGWPDLQFIGPGGISLFLELKLPKGVVQDNQKELGKKFGELGANFAVARSCQEAETILLAWGIPLSVKFEEYLAAWTRKDRLTAEEFSRFIIAAAPVSRPKKAKSTPSKPKVPNGTRSKLGKRHAA